MTDLPSELRTLVKRYGTRVLDDADGLRATLDDFLDEGTAAPGDVNLLTDAVRFGSLERLKTLLDQGAEPSAATADVAGALAQRRGGDAESAYWACAVLGYAADLLPGDLIPGTWMVPSSQVPSSQVPSSQVPSSQVPSSQVPSSETATGATSAQARNQGAEVTDSSGQSGPAPFDDGNVTHQSGGGFSSVDNPSNGSDRHDSRPANSGKSWALVAGGVVAAVLLAVGVGSVLSQRGDDNAGASDSGHMVKVTDLAGFYHFGTEEAFQRALKPDCANAAIMGTAPDVKCSFVDYPGFEVEFTEKDPIIRDTNGTLPGFVTSPEARTIVTVQPSSGGDESQHAYFMKRVSSGNDAESPDDDEVLLTLYDVDPEHPGAAIFTTEDSTSNPLTRDKANQLLDAIGSDSEKFPPPIPFQSKPMKDFAQAFLDQKSSVECSRAFAKFRGELEHVVCQDDPVVINFGLSAFKKANFKYWNSRFPKYTIGTGDTGSGRLIITTKNGLTSLFWYEDSRQAWGALTAKATDSDGGDLLEYFKTFQDVREFSFQ